MRLIDATRLVKLALLERDKIPLSVKERHGLGTESPNHHGQSMRGGIRKILRLIEQAPTIDAVPVVHAKWIPHKPGDVHACSSCGFGVLVSMWFKNGMGIGPRISHNKFRYCPYCGAMMSNAKMDGVPHDDSGQ